MAATDDSAAQPGGEDSGGLVLVLNSGSSSAKFAVLDSETGERALGGSAEVMGTPKAVLRSRRYPADVAGAASARK